MGKYIVTYHESYNKAYEIEAASREEAEEIVKHDIHTGKREDELRR